AIAIRTGTCRGRRARLVPTNYTGRGCPCSPYRGYNLKLTLATIILAPCHHHHMWLPLPLSSRSPSSKPRADLLPLSLSLSHSTWPHCAILCLSFPVMQQVFVGLYLLESNLKNRRDCKP